MCISKLTCAQRARCGLNPTSEQRCKYGDTSACKSQCIGVWECSFHPRALLQDRCLANTLEDCGSTNEPNLEKIVIPKYFARFLTPVVIYQKNIYVFIAYHHPQQSFLPGFNNNAAFTSLTATSGSLADSSNSQPYASHWDP